MCIRDRDKVAYIDTSELLSTSLAAKQGNLDANGLLVVAANPYVTADKNKVAFIDTGVLLSTSLATKQATIGDGDLTIGQTSNLQTALDARQTTVAQEAAYRKIADSYTETEVNSALLLKAAVDNPTFTTKITTPELHCSNLMSQNSHLQLGSQHTNDVNIYLNGQETLQITRSGSEVRYTAHGGSGSNRFNQDVACNANLDVSGTATAANLVVTADKPASFDSSGVQHEIRVDDDYIYVRKANGTSARVAVTTWSS